MPMHVNPEWMRLQIEKAPNAVIKNLVSAHRDLHGDSFATQAEAQVMYDCPEHAREFFYSNPDDKTTFMYFRALDDSCSSVYSWRDLKFETRVERMFRPIKILMQDMNEIWSPVEEGMEFIRGMQTIAKAASEIAAEATDQVLEYTSWQKFKKVED
jgi:hypothetical protein